MTVVNNYKPSTDTLTVVEGDLIGDFIEFYQDDAVAVAKALELTITYPKKMEGKPMAGIPAHAFKRYQMQLLDKAGIVVLLDMTKYPCQIKKAYL